MPQNTDSPVINCDGYHYFCPLKGDGSFGSLCVAKVLYENNVCKVQTIRDATYAEQCRLFDAHQTYMFWYLLLSIPVSAGDSGILLMCRPYTEGVQGQALPHLENKIKQTPDGSRV